MIRERERMIILPRTEFRAASDDGSVYGARRSDALQTSQIGRKLRIDDDHNATRRTLLRRRTASSSLLLQRQGEPQSRRAYSRPLSVGGRGTKARHAPAEQAQQRRPYRVQSSSAPPVGPGPAGADGAQMPAVLFQFTRTITETGNHRGDVGKCITAV